MKYTFAIGREFVLRSVLNLLKYNQMQSSYWIPMCWFESASVEFGQLGY